MSDSKLRLDLSRTQGIQPNRGFDGFGLFSAAEGARDRWRHLSPRRRLASVVPLVLALVANVVIPSYASGDTFKVDGLANTQPACVALSGGAYNAFDYPVHGAGAESMRGTGGGPLCNLFFAQLGGNASQCLPGCEFVGDYQLTDQQTGAKKYAYCVDLATYRNLNATYSNGPVADVHVAYILAHYYPFVAPRWNADAEATAVQLGIWYFSDNNTFGADTMDPWNAHDIPFEEPSDTRIPQDWVDRWAAVVTDARDNAQTWAASLPASNWSLGLSSSSNSVNVGGSATVTATLTGVPVDQTITFKTSSGLLNGGSAPVNVLTSGGKASVTLSGVAASQSASVSASTTVSSESAVVLVATQSGPSQKLVYAVPESTTQSQVLAIPFVGTPSITATKSVDGTTNYSIKNPGETLHFAIDVTNSGNLDLPSFTVTDVLKGNNLDLLQNVNPGPGGVFDSSTRNLTWTGGALAIGKSAQVTFDANVPSDLPHGTETCFVNVASASAPGTTGVSTNQVTACITPGVCPTVSPTVSITGPTNVSPGQVVTYNVVAGNNGANTFGGTLTVQVPTGFTITSTVPAGSVNGTTATFNIAALGPAETRNFAVSATSPANQTAGTVTANTTLVGNATDIPAGCPPASATVNASTSGGVLISAVQGITTGPAVPFTGAGQGFMRTTIVGLALALSGFIFMSNRRREYTDWKRESIPPGPQA